MPRTIAIGDIHGCSTALAKLIELIDPQPEDVVVPLGDFMDRGIDSKGVIDQLISLGDRWVIRFSSPLLPDHLWLTAFQVPSASCSKRNVQVTAGLPSVAW